MLIALSGCDGSGKTTIAINLVNFLKDCGVRVGYRREFEYFLLKYVLKSLGDRANIERRKFLRKEDESSTVDYLKYKLWPLLVWLDSNIETAYLKLSNRGIVVLDRCIVDHLAGFEHLKYIDENVRDLLLKWSLKPDLITVLDAPPEIMYERKRRTHDYQLGFYKKQRKRYLNMAMKLKAPIVRTDKPLDESLAEVLQRILLRFGKAEDLVLHVLSDPLSSSDESFSATLLKNIEWNNLDLGYLIIEATRNNVEFPFYERLFFQLNNNVVGRILSAIKIKHRKLLEVLTTVTELFEGSGISYVVFKTIPPYKYLPRDIDILVDEKDLKKTINLLVSKGFRLTKTHIIHKEASLAKDDVEIDLHWQVKWMGKKTVNTDSILRNFITCKLEYIDVNVPCPTHEFLLVVSHAILQHHYVTLGEIHYIRSLIAKYNINWEYVLNVVRRLGIFRSFLCTLSIVMVKDKLFYRSIREKALPLLFTYGTIRTIMKPVIWLGVVSKRIMNILDVADVMLTLYRKSKYELTKELPYNMPLGEILDIVRGIEI